MELRDVWCKMVLKIMYLKGLKNNHRNVYYKKNPFMNLKIFCTQTNLTCGFIFHKLFEVLSYNS